jgi:hypothetical protein
MDFEGKSYEINTISQTTTRTKVFLRRKKNRSRDLCKNNIERTTVQARSLMALQIKPKLTEKL